MHEVHDSCFSCLCATVSDAVLCASFYCDASCGGCEVTVCICVLAVFFTCARCILLFVSCRQFAAGLCFVCHRVGRRVAVVLAQDVVFRANRIS